MWFKTDAQPAIQLRKLKKGNLQFYCIIHKEELFGCEEMTSSAISSFTWAGLYKLVTFWKWTWRHSMSVMHAGILRHLLHWHAYFQLTENGGRASSLPQDEIRIDIMSIINQSINVTYKAPKSLKKCSEALKYTKSYLYASWKRWLFRSTFNVSNWLFLIYAGNLFQILGA